MMSSGSDAGPTLVDTPTPAVERVVEPASPAPTDGSQPASTITEPAEPESVVPDLSALTTAAALAGDDEAPTNVEPLDPNVFTQGMRVMHPEFGLGKIVALSGNGKQRTATVNFVTNGERTFVLAFSPLRPH